MTILVCYYKKSIYYLVTTPFPYIVGTFNQGDDILGICFQHFHRRFRDHFTKLLKKKKKI